MAVKIFVYEETQVGVYPTTEPGARVVEASGVVLKGKDGISPVVSISAIEGGHRITITDVNGDKIVDVLDGKNGSPGKDGNGIKTAALNDDYTLALTFDDGTSYTTPSLRGAPGRPGQDGTPATHSWNGTVLEVTSASGTSSADLRGPKGEGGVSPTVAVSKSGKVTTVAITDKNGTKTATINDGVDGNNGKDGTSVTVKSVSESTADGGSNVVTFSDGKTVTIKNGSKGSTGATGQRGTGLLAVTTAPSSYTTAVGGITPKYRMALSTIKTQAGVTEVLLGDTVRYSYYHYPIDYMDASYAYFTERVSIRGATGGAGKTAYAYAQDGGYTGTEAEFAEKLANEYNLNPLHGKKVSFLGDSICAGDSATHPGGYGKIIADRNGMVYENVARGGATVTAETYSRSTGAAKPWLCRMVENMSADADYAIIEGGINDGWDETVKANIGRISVGYNATLDDTTYYGAFESMLKQLVTKFQGKKIGYIAVPKIHSLFDSNQNAPNFYHIALECCAKWGVSVCDLNTITPPVEYLSDLGTTYTADGTHPTYEGYIKYYCDPIEAWMKTLTTGASVSVGGGSVDTSDFVSKNDIQIKKAQLTLEDGSTVLIDVVVASAGTTIQKYLNLIPTSIAADGSIYNGGGWKTDTRLSSTGVEKTSAGAICTGFIPAVGGDVIRLGGDAPWYQSGKNDNYICAYDSNFNYIGGVYNSIGGYSYTKNIAASHEVGDVTKVTLASGMNIAYIRANWPNNTATMTNGNSLIITVNQEIT